jgi:ABC-type branched-subunit amino acid transport system substrate-binding protein
MIQKFLTLSLIVTLLSNCALPVDTNVSRRNAPAPLTQVGPDSGGKRTPPSNVVTVSDEMAFSSPDSSPSGQGWQVALLVPQSGKYQALGQALAESAALSLARLPSANRLHLSVMDTASLSQSTVQAMKERILKENVKLIIGPVFAEQAQILRGALANTAGAPPLIAFSNTTSIASPPLFVAGFDPFAEILAATNALAGQGSCHVLILPATKAGSALEPTLKQTLTAKGARILGMMYYQEASFKDLSPTLTQAASSTAGCTPTPSGNAFTTVVALSGSPLKSVLPVLEGIASDVIAPALAPPTAKPVFFADVDQQVWEEVQRYYQQALGRDASRLDVIAYDMVSLAAYVEQSGGDAQASLKTTAGFKGLVGLFRFQDAGTIQRTLAVYKKDQGQVTLIAPAAQRFAP